MPSGPGRSPQLQATLSVEVSRPDPLIRAFLGSAKGVMATSAHPRRERPARRETGCRERPCRGRSSARWPAGLASETPRVLPKARGGRPSRSGLPGGLPRAGFVGGRVPRRRCSRRLQAPSAPGAGRTLDWRTVRPGSRRRVGGLDGSGLGWTCSRPWRVRPGPWSPDVHRGCERPFIVNATQGGSNGWSTLDPDSKRKGGGA